MSGFFKRINQVISVILVLLGLGFSKVGLLIFVVMLLVYGFVRWLFTGRRETAEETSGKTLFLGNLLLAICLFVGLGLAEI